MEKLCTKCKDAKPTEEFFKNKNKSGGLDNWCKKCYGDWRRTDAKGKIRERKEKLKKRYNITEEEYQMLLKFQKNGCKICGNKKTEANRKMSVDHCHKTNKVRGLLCDQCNRGLGMFKDDVLTLQRAIYYLELSRDL